MTIAIFTHSLLSDWNHGNAHFLRGMVREMQEAGHVVRVFEPEGSWSLTNLIKDRGRRALEGFHKSYPSLRSTIYQLRNLDLNVALKGVDLVLVHEWSEHELVQKVGAHHRANPGYRLLFHDTHHRSITDPESMSGYDLSAYDGVLAFGNVVRDVYLKRGWAKRAWTWHEAADPKVFHPLPQSQKEGDLVWIGNWGDGERSEELHEFLLRPVKELGLKAKVYGVRYPDAALVALKDAGIEYGGSLANYEAPEVFSKFSMTVHVPRRPYVEALPGIPTIRVFEALACGIPLISAPWSDSEHLFTPGEDFAVAKDGEAMTKQIQRLIEHPWQARALSTQGLQTVLSRHTCKHRLNELMKIVAELEHVPEGAALSR